MRNFTLSGRKNLPGKHYWESSWGLLVGMAQFSMIFFNLFYVVMEFIKTEEKHECGFPRDQSLLFQKGLVHSHVSHFPEHSRVSEQMHFKSERVVFSSAGSISLLVLVRWSACTSLCIDQPAHPHAETADCQSSCLHLIPEIVAWGKMVIL